MATGEALSGNVWIHRWGAPVTWPRALAFCGVLGVAFVVVFVIPILTVGGWIEGGWGK